MSNRTQTRKATDPVAATRAAVSWLRADLDALVDSCTDPRGADLAALLADVGEAADQLRTIARDVELATANAMLGDELDAGDLYVERSRGTDRKAWSHDDWQRDVRAKVVQAAGLKGAQIVTAAGELVPAAEVVHEALAAVQSAHGATAPKTTALRGLGLDARDYCESSPGAWRVKVQRRAVEGDQDEQGAA